MSVANSTSCGRGSFLPTPLAVTRSARRVSNSANVPRLGLCPNLILDVATSDTQHTPLVAAGYFMQRQLSGVQIVATPSRQFSANRLDKVFSGCQRSHVGRGVGFLAKPQVQGSDSNIHAKHPLGTPEGWWILVSNPNKPGQTNTFRPQIALNPQLLEGGENE